MIEDEYDKRVNDLIDNFSELEPSVKTIRLASEVFSLIGELQGTIIALKWKLVINGEKNER